MCMALFAGADEPLAQIEWQESSPAFYVQPLSQTDESVRHRFTKAHVYYMGAHTGCSCGFNYGQIEPVTAEDHAEEAAGRASVAALQQFLRQAVLRLGEVELFSSWEGDWAEEPERHLDVTPDWFGGEAFKLPERVAFRVRALEGRQ